ncbi:unnamed protein product [Lactuca saligna]|uniref:ADF-H domain-containing protein n=1 Tax=Lactuca saligna TaxID=75948 RepID=A0AA35YHK7_LACSI|nr:unnamed protein product [Lactuca saligna]
MTVAGKNVAANAHYSGPSSPSTPILSSSALSIILHLHHQPWRMRHLEWLLTINVIVDKIGGPDKNYEDFTNSLPGDECRYAVFDFDFITDENCQKSKIIFIAWSPDTSKVRMKMVYASSKDRFKRELDGIQVELQATDPSEMSFDILKSRANI